MYGSLAVVILILVATMALTTRQPPPPSIAEFAPQAVEQIKEAPAELTSQFGSGDGAGDAPAAAETRDAAARSDTKVPAVEVPRVRRCVGDPPRQTEDPQSPPCVPYWAGNNGGSTARGVTGTEIRIMIPTPQGVSAAKRIYPALEKFFNKRFEFYGRKLVFRYPANGNYNGSQDPAVQKADATFAADEQKVFASTMYRTTQGFHYHEELARRGIPSVTGGITAYESSYLASFGPHMWSYLIEADPMFANLGEWACKRLAGRKAAHAGDPVLQDKTRKFGVLFQAFFDSEQTSTKPLEDKLMSCGAASALTLRNPIRTPGGDGNQASGREPASATSAILKMQQQGVTSIICLCQVYAAGTFMTAASNQAFVPEWIFSSYGTLDFNAAITAIANAPPQQMAHAFGLTFQPRQLAPLNEPSVWAIKEVEPDYDMVQYGDSISIALATTVYRPLLVLASGIQMAGPNLTPETFERGLKRAVFPNPPHPNEEGRVGFAPNRHAMTMDAAEMWWSNEAPSPYVERGGGTYCYVDGGARHGLGTWPSAPDRFFAGPCDSGAP